MNRVRFIRADKLAGLIVTCTLLFEGTHRPWDFRDDQELIFAPMMASFSGLVPLANSEFVTDLAVAGTAMRLTVLFWMLTAVWLGFEPRMKRAY